MHRLCGQDVQMQRRVRRYCKVRRVEHAHARFWVAAYAACGCRTHVAVRHMLLPRRTYGCAWPPRRAPPARCCCLLQEALSAVLPGLLARHGSAGDAEVLEAAIKRLLPLLHGGAGGAADDPMLQLEVAEELQVGRGAGARG